MNGVGSFRLVLGFNMDQRRRNSFGKQTVPPIGRLNSVLKHVFTSSEAHFTLSPFPERQPTSYLNVQGSQEQRPHLLFRWLFIPAFISEHNLDCLIGHNMPS